MTAYETGGAKLVLAGPSYTKLKVALTAHVRKTKQRRHTRCMHAKPGEILRPVIFLVCLTQQVVVPVAVETGEIYLQTSSVFSAAGKRGSSLSGVLQVSTCEILLTFLNARCYFGASYPCYAHRYTLLKDRLALEGHRQLTIRKPPTSHTLQSPHLLLCNIHAGYFQLL